MSLEGKNPYSFIFTHLLCFMLLTPFYKCKFPHDFISLQPEAFSFSFDTVLLATYSLIFSLSEKNLYSTFTYFVISIYKIQSRDICFFSDFHVVWSPLSWFLSSSFGLHCFGASLWLRL